MSMLWRVGLRTERAARSVCHHQSAVCPSACRHVSLLSTRDLRRHLTQDDLPSRPRTRYHSPVKLFRMCSAFYSLMF